MFSQSNSPTAWGARSTQYSGSSIDQGWRQIPHHCDGSIQHSQYQWPGILEAIAALPPRLNKVAWDLHSQSGVPLEIILGEMLTILVFVCSGLANVRDIKGDPTPISTIAYILAPTLSNKSTGYRRLMRAVLAAMDDWDSEWLLFDITAAGLKKLAPEYALYVPGPEEGGVHFESPISKAYALFISLRDSIMPLSIRADQKKKEGKSKGRTRFTTAVIAQKVYHDEWLEKNRKKALASGMLQRVWIVWTLTQFDKSIIGRYPDAAGGLEGWDARISQLMNESKDGVIAGLENLPIFDASTQAQRIRLQEQDRYEQLAKDGGPLAQDPAFAGRRHETMTTLAAIFHLFEGEGNTVSGEMMDCAVKVTAFLTGQWWALVYPPEPLPPIPQLILDAEMLDARLRQAARETGEACWAEADIYLLGRSFGWPKDKTDKAMRALYEHDRAMPNRRSRNGRPVDVLELLGSPFFPPAPMYLSPPPAYIPPPQKYQPRI